MSLTGVTHIPNLVADNPANGREWELNGLLGPF